jgi:hypothetical protein
MTKSKIVTVSRTAGSSVDRKIKRVVEKLAKSRNLDVDSIHEQLVEKIKLLNKDKGLGYLTYAGVLDLQLPDGTRVAIIPDWHIPAHDRPVSWQVQEWLAKFRPHIVIIIGDAADMFGLSRWPKAPRVIANSQNELDETRRIMDRVIAISGCLHLFYIMGNHEDRNRRTQTDPNSNVAGLIDPNTHEPILNFHQLMGYTRHDPITFVYGLSEEGGGGGGVLVNNDFKFIHGKIVRGKPGQSPYAEADSQLQSVGHGHTHRLAKRARRITKMHTLRSFEFGHLADELHAYMGYTTYPNWQHGLGAGLVHGGKLHIQILPILKVRDGANQTRSALLFKGELSLSSGY